MRYRQLILLIISGFAFGCGSVGTVPNIDPPNNHFVFKENISTPLSLPQALVTDKTSQYFFVAVKGRGVSVYKKGEPKSQYISNIGPTQLAGLHAMNLDRKGDFLYIALGDFFGSGSKAGLAIINISNPLSPKLSSIWTSPTTLEGTAIVKVDGNHAYLGAMKEGVFVFNVSNKNKISLVSQFKPNPNFPIPNPNSVQHPNARGMDIKGNRLYLCNDAGGVRIVDISNKQNLQEIGRYINTSPNMKQQAYNNIIVNGNYAYTAVDYCGLEILDVTNPAQIKLVGWWNPWNCNTASNNWFNSKGHVNQLAYDATKKQIYLSSGRSELNVIDVSRPSLPKEVKNYGQPDNKKATWGMTKDGPNVYLLYITSIVPFKANWAGIKIIAEK